MQNMRHSLGFRAPGKTGEYMVAYRILQDQQTVSSGITLFRVQPPLALKLEPYWLKSQVIRVIADLDKVDRQTDALAKLTIENENGDILSQSEATVKADALVQSMLVSTKGLKPDYYRVRMKLLDQAGQLIVQNTQPIHKPQTPVWTWVLTTENRPAYFSVGTRQNSATAQTLIRKPIQELHPESRSITFRLQVTQ